MQQHERAALGRDRRAELTEHDQAGVIGTLEAPQIDEHPAMTVPLQGLDGAGQQVGALHGQSPPRPDRARTTIDDLCEGSCSVCHWSALRFVALAPGKEPSVFGTA